MRSLIDRFRDLSIRSQLIVGIVLGQAFLMGVLVYVLIGNQREFLRESHRDEVASLVETLAVSSSSWVMANDVAGLQEVIGAVAKGPSVRYAMFLARDGKVLAHSNAALIGQYVSDPTSLKLLSAATQLTDLHVSDEAIDLAAPVVYEGRHFGWARVSLSNQEMNEQLVANVRFGLFFILLALVLGSLVGFAIVRGFSRDLSRLLGGLAALRSGQRGFRLEGARRNEIGQLSSDFNSMMDAMEAQERETLRKTEELATERLRLENIIEGTRAGTWEWHVQTGQTLFNERWAEILGYSLEELEPVSLDTWIRLTDPEDLKRSEQQLQLCFDRQLDYYECQARMLHKDGHWVWIQDRGKVVRWLPDGRPDLMAGTHIDISGIKRIEEELDQHRFHLEEMLSKRTVELVDANAQLERARGVAEAANRAKSVFLASMSHEIRTPLNAITGMAYLLGRELSDARQMERLRKINEAAAHLLSIINDVLDLSKIEADKLQFEVQSVDIGALVREACAMIEVRIGNRDIVLENELPALPEGLLGDATRLRQALINYLSNAVKFTEHGRIGVRVEVLEQTETSCLLRFSVSDTGIGIAPDVVGKLFHPFVQADGSITREYGGTGLGLVITQRLAVAMGGGAGVESQPGLGSTFWFTARLPINSALRPAEPSPVVDSCSDPELLVGKRILIVDDEPLNREIAEEFLLDAGFVVDTAEDGVIALEMAEKTAYALILMDVQMPRMDGLETTRRLRAMSDYATTPIIAMTANAFAEDRAQCAAAGMSDFVGKPFVPTDLIRVITNWLCSVRGA